MKLLCEQPCHFRRSARGNLAILADVKVFPRCLQRLVSHHRLNFDKVCSIFKEVRGEAMSKSVWRETNVDADLSFRLLQRSCDVGHIAVVPPSFARFWTL